MIVRSTRSMVCACLVALVVSAVLPAWRRSRPATSPARSRTAGRRRARRDGRPDRRGARHQARARDDGRDRRLHVPERHGRHLHGGSDDERVQDRAAQRLPVSGGDRVSVPAITLEVGGQTEAVTVIAESPLIQAQSGERSFAVTTEQVENLPINHGNFTSLVQLTPGVREPAARRRRHPHGRRQPEQHHDGRHLGHGHGQQRPDAQHEHRVDRRGEDPDAGLPGGIRPVERTADHRGLQERHQPLPRRRLRRS